MAKDILIFILLSVIAYFLYIGIGMRMNQVYDEGLTNGYGVGRSSCPDVEYRPS